LKELKYGYKYKYAHDYEGHFIIENYLPEELKNKQYYFPTEAGQEKTIKDRLMNWWKGKKKY
jgi:putative ATPase